MEEGIHSLQERQLSREFLGMDYPPLYLCKPKRGIKRDDTKETYKLPHRLIEKKRRDRINECIAQLKDLLPEHLKLTTLGHLEKAVVLELTLKHLKGLTSLTEQQHQKIVSLQNGERSMKSPLQSDLDAFHSGFQTCAKEVLQYLSRFESWTSRDQRCTQLLNHLHTVSSQILPSSQVLLPQGPPAKSSPQSPGRGLPKVENQPNCVPVIQRTHNLELSENDTDTDSGYGGEGEKPERQGNVGAKGQGANGVTVKQEPLDEPSLKRFKPDCSGASTGAAGTEPAMRPDANLLNSLMGFGSSPFGQQAPFCLPFYFISPSAAAAAAAYMPFLDKGSLEKYLYPAATGAPIPFIYPGLSTQAAGTFPCLSSVLSPEKLTNCSAALLPDLSSSPFQAGPAMTDLQDPLQDLRPAPKDN